MESALIKHAYAIKLERSMTKMIQKAFEPLKKVETEKDELNVIKLKLSIQVLKNQLHKRKLGKAGFEAVRMGKVSFN